MGRSASVWAGSGELHIAGKCSTGRVPVSVIWNSFRNGICYPGIKAKSYLKSAEEQNNLSMVYRKVAFWGAVQKQGLIGDVVMCVAFLFCWFDLVWGFFTVR